MKLYATVTSERATKRQGGNKYLNISLLVGSRDNQIEAGVISMRSLDDKFLIIYHARHAQGGIKLFELPRGKK